MNTGRTWFKKGRQVPDKDKETARKVCIERNKSNNPVWNQQVREKIRKTLIGRKASEETKFKQSIAQLGEKGSNWQGGKTQGQRIRMTAVYRKWRIAVLKKDNYTCQVCLKRGGNLEVHHIKPFSKYPELWIDINNGQAMHRICHTQVHK